MKYKISAAQYLEIKAAQKANRDKQIENRLKVLALRYEGKNLQEIGAATGFHHAHNSNLIRKYFEEGLQAISEKHYAGNRRNMSKEEEAAFLEQYRQPGEEGHILDVQEIKVAYEKRVGHNLRPAYMSWARPFIRREIGHAFSGLSRLPKFAFCFSIFALYEFAIVCI